MRDINNRDLKRFIESLVTEFKGSHSVDISGRREHLFREIVRALLASKRLANYYERTLIAVHRKNGTLNLRLWDSDSVFIDYESLITKGVWLFQLKQLVLLVITPFTLSTAAEYLHEELQRDARVSGDWKKTFPKKLTPSLKEYMTSHSTICTGKHEPKDMTYKLDPQSVQHTSYDLAVNSSGTSVEEFDFLSTSIVDKDSLRECLRCGCVIYVEEETCPICRCCPTEEYYASSLTEDSEFQYHLVEEYGASLKSSFACPSFI